jgi:hypothetical protein
MGRITLTADRFNLALENLKKHYKYEYGTCITPEDKAIIETDINVQQLRQGLRNCFGVCENEEILLDTFCIVSYYLRKDSLGLSTNIFNNLNMLLRKDLLKLYLAVYENKNTATWISLRTVDGTIRLNNYCNWFLDDMVKEYLSKNLSDVSSVEEATEELCRIKRRRGRIPNDPRLSLLMWGTYTFLKEHYSFKSPMPNVLCQFIIIYLQELDILPQDTEIDTFWVRAQLRYLNSKKEIKYE